MSKIAEQITEV